MEMSLVEVIGRANFLIYEYIKKTLNHGDLAEKFRNVIQDSVHKDIIIFKGLEDLTSVLLKYYSSQVAAAGELPNGSAVAGETGKANPDAADAEAAGESKQARKKKRKQQQQQQQQRQLEAEASAKPEVPEPEAEPAVVVEPAEQQQQAEADSSKAERKKRKKKRRLEAEAEAEAEGGAEQPEATNGQAAEAATAEATTPPAAGEVEDAPKKKRKKQHRAAAAAAAESAEVGNACQESDNLTERSGGRDGDAAGAALAETEAAVNGNGGGSGAKKRHSQPYRRVREEEVVNKHFHDNSFDAKPGSAGGWGYKANEDLKPTQGRSFRHEKTKKKRGSYKGGAIDTEVWSFKFESDSE